MPRFVPRDLRKDIRRLGIDLAEDALVHRELIASALLEHLKDEVRLHHAVLIGERLVEEAAHLARDAIDDLELVRDRTRIDVRALHRRAKELAVPYLVVSVASDQLLQSGIVDERDRVIEDARFSVVLGFGDLLEDV